MPRNHPDEIFKYPPVQYIPLKIKNEIIEEYSHNNFSSHFSIFTPEKEEFLQRKIRSLSNQKINYKINNNQLAILIYNGIIDYIKYRGHEIFMVGNRVSEKFQLFKITSEYFYKDSLIFSFYDQQSGSRIHRKSFTPEK